MGAELIERDIFEVANQLEGYVGPDTPEPLANFLLCEGKAAAALADEIVRLRAALSLAESRGRQIGREEAAKVVDDNQIYDSSAGQGVEPRHYGNRAGLAYAAAIRNLPTNEAGE